GACAAAGLARRAHVVRHPASVRTRAEPPKEIPPSFARGVNAQRSGCWPASAPGSNGAPDCVPALVASVVAASDWRLASASASAGLVRADSGSASPSGEPPPERHGTPSSSPSGSPPKPFVIDLSAAVNSVGMNHTLFDCVLATSGSSCRYWYARSLVSASPRL